MTPNERISRIARREPVDRPGIDYYATPEFDRMLKDHLRTDDDEAVRILEESLEEVNLAIVDSLGGERDSAETFGRLHSAKPDLKMIVSCPGSPGRTGETLLDGTARLIHKPVKLDELSAAVRQLLGSSGK